MLKKTITFEDLDGKKITEDFYFHLSKAEAAEMEMSHKGGLTEYMKRIVAEEDGNKLVGIFKDLLTKTIGRRSEDGRRFIKNQDIIDDFIQTDAYSELFIELATDAGQAAAFINGVIPVSMQEEVKKRQAETSTELPALSDIPVVSDAAQSPSLSVEQKIEEKFKDPSWVPSQADLLNMNQDQMRRAFQRKNTTP